MFLSCPFFMSLAWYLTSSVVGLGVDSLRLIGLETDGLNWNEWDGSSVRGVGVQVRQLLV